MTKPREFTPDETRFVEELIERDRQIHRRDPDDPMLTLDFGDPRWPEQLFQLAHQGHLAQDCAACAEVARFTRA